MRKLLLVLFIVFPVSFSWAANLGQKVQNTYKNTSSFEASFKQSTQVKLLDRNVEEKGRVVFQKPGHFIIHYQGTNERKYLSDGNTLWIHRPKDKEVEVYQNMKSIVSKEALVFLGGLSRMTDEFSVKEISVNTLSLRPKNSKSAFTQIILNVDPIDYLVKQARLFPKSGNQSYYEFEDVKLNNNRPENDFLPPHSGVNFRTISK